MDFLPRLKYEISSLAVYRSLREKPVILSLFKFSDLLGSASDEDRLEQMIHHYTAICTELFESGFRGSLYDYMYDAVLYDNNIFTSESANGRHHDLPEQVNRACCQDLDFLYCLAKLPSSALKGAISALFPDCTDLINRLPDYNNKPVLFKDIGNWKNLTEDFASFNKENGVSIFAKYYAFHYSGNYGLEPVKNFDSIRLSDLKHYETQRQKIIDNTRGFLEGKTFNNVLLYGDRGTGKSSTVKALLNEYKTSGLRMVEIPKQELTNLDKVIHLIEDIPLKFILFIDDLAFDENDPSFGILKALLEGSLVRRPDNIAVYATTNRRHLIKETFSGREGDEVHRTDTIDEALSLSDRFGLYITFTLPDKNKFLDIVKLLADDRGIVIDEETLFRGAEQFAMRKSGRSPRLARQYIDYIQARQSMNLPLF